MLQSNVTALGAQWNAFAAQLSRDFQAQTRISNCGVAQALAMAGSFDLRPDENFAVSMNVGSFRGQTAFASGAVARLSEHWSLNAGVTAGVNGGPMGARAGIRFGW